MSGNKAAALAEKEKGNEAYKRKDFDAALKHYDTAMNLDPDDITFVNNKAAVYFEQKDYDQCIKLCQQAIDVGREHRADFKLIAKAFARIASAYAKQDKLDKARTYFQKSLSEHRTPDTLSKLNEIEKTLKEREARAYIDPQKSLEEKDKGNAAFKSGDYPTAIKHYTEAIKRNPDDAKIYSNRAACYQKLAEFSLACKDADECIRRDKTFVKGYIRKGLALLAMKKGSDAADAFQKALDIDPTNQEAMDGYTKSLVSTDPKEMRERALQNPEIQEILKDPAMQMILQQGQSDPKALAEHLQNPEVARKFQKLMEAGIVQVK